MINTDNLNKLYDDVIENKQLTTSSLKGYGFNSNDLTVFVNSGFLKRERPGYYQLVAANSLFNYGKYLISKKEWKKAKSCFEKCFEIDNTNMLTCVICFLKCIEYREFDKAFIYFDHFLKNSNECSDKDKKLYLHLFSIIVDLPDEYKKYVESLTINDVILDNGDKKIYKNIPKQNKIRTSIFNRRFNYAKKQSDEYLNQNGKLKLNYSDIVMSTLISCILKEKDINDIIIIKYISRKKYNNAINILDKMCQKMNLSDNYEYIRSLLVDLNKITVDGKAPKVRNTKTNNMYYAIKNKNYELALSILSEIYKLSGKYNREYHILYLLLNDIICEIARLNQDSDPNKCNDSSDNKKLNYKNNNYQSNK